MKKLIIVILILSLAIIAPINNNLTPKAEAATTKYIVKADVEYTITPNEKITLYVKTKKAVIWSSSNKSIAAVSKSGVVTGRSEGMVIITARVGNEKYKCTVTVKDYSDWILFGTDDYDLMRDGVLIGEVIYYEDDYYYISPEYYNEIIAPWLESIRSAENEGSFIGKSDNILTPDTEVIFDNGAEEETVSADGINEMKRYGFGTSEDIDTEIGKAYMKFCDTWISEYELKNTYGISTVWSWPDNKIYLIIDTNNKYVIEGTSDKFVSGTVYTNDEVRYQYLEKFEYNEKSYTENQYYFNREDLINKDIIK